MQFGWFFLQKTLIQRHKTKTMTTHMKHALWAISATNSIKIYSNCRWMNKKSSTQKIDTFKTYLMKSCEKKKQFKMKNVKWKGYFICLRFHCYLVDFAQIFFFTQPKMKSVSEFSIFKILWQNQRFNDGKRTLPMKLGAVVSPFYVFEFFSSVFVFSFLFFFRMRGWVCLPMILLSVPTSFSLQCNSSVPSVHCLTPSQRNFFSTQSPSPQRNSCALHE